MSPADAQLLAILATTSKVPLYVAGGLLALWAVVLAAIGLSRAEFPGSLSGQRLVVAVTGLLVVATAASAVATASKPENEGKEVGTAPEEQPAPGQGQAAPTPGGPQALAADPTGQLAYDKKSLKVRPGKVTIEFDNRSPVPHDVTIAKGSKVLAKTREISKSSAKLTATLAPGSYVFYCSVDGHRQAGMQGTLTAS